MNALYLDLSCQRRKYKYYAEFSPLRLSFRHNNIWTLSYLKAHTFSQFVCILQIWFRFRWCLCHIVVKPNIETHIWQNSSKALILQPYDCYKISLFIYLKIADMIKKYRKNLMIIISSEFISFQECICGMVGGWLGCKVVLCKFRDCGIFTPNYNRGGPLRLYNVYILYII